MADKQRAPAMTWERLLVTGLILTVLYCDVVTHINLMNWNLRLPQYNATWRAFAMFRVFDSWQDYNSIYGVEVLARRLDQLPHQAKWEPFNIKPYYPDPPDDRRIRFSGAAANREHFCAEIERLYKMHHPGMTVDEVSMHTLKWPKSPDGYATHREDYLKTRIFSKAHGQPVQSAQQ